MKTDILNTTQNPDELRRLAQDLLDKQTQRIHTLENDNAAIQAEKLLSGTAYPRAGSDDAGSHNGI